MSSKKTPPRPDAAYFLDIQPRLSGRAHSISESLLASGLLPQACCSRRANQRVCSPPQWFHSSIVTAPIGSLKLTSIPVAQLHRWQRMVLSEQVTTSSTWSRAPETPIELRPEPTI